MKTRWYLLTLGLFLGISSPTFAIAFKSTEKLCADALEGKIEFVFSQPQEDIADAHAVMAGLNELTTREQKLAVSDALKPYRDPTSNTAPAGVQDFRAKAIVREFPGVFIAARKHVVAQPDAFELILEILNSSHRLSPVPPVEALRRLAPVFEAARDKGVYLHGEMEEILTLIRRAGRHGFTDHALSCLEWGYRAGLTTAEVYGFIDHIAETQGGAGALAVTKLLLAFRAVAFYGTDPFLALKALRAILRHDGLDPYFLLIAEGIETSVLLRHESADDLVKTVVDLTQNFQTTEQLLPPLEELRVSLIKTSHTYRRSTHPRSQFPLLKGHLRRAPFPFQIRKSYADGIQDLKKLAADPYNETIGAFVFDPATTTWFCLGGRTLSSFKPLEMFLELPDYRQSQFGPKASLVFSHPLIMRTFVGTGAPFFFSGIPTFQELSLLKNFYGDFLRDGIRIVTSDHVIRGTVTKMPRREGYREALQKLKGLIASTDSSWLLSPKQKEALVFALTYSFNDLFRGQITIHREP